MRLLLLFPLALVAMQATAQSVPAHAVLAVLETSDLHAAVVGYNYVKLAPDASLGIDRTATLIAQARREFDNTLLIDAGDTIQGNPLADYQALVAPVGCAERLAIFKAMNRLGYDAGTLGNHDFDYGLPFLRQVTGTPACAGPAFPLVQANVVDARSGQPLYAPYVIINKTMRASGADGKPVVLTLKVGILGLVPPVIMDWNRRQLEGNVVVHGVRETAERYVPEMRAKGADLVIAVLHGGLDGAPYAPSMENAGYYLARVAGIDAMLMGHMHLSFPNAASSNPKFNLAGVDKVRGSVHGVPALMPDMWGKSLGVLALQLQHDEHGWHVERDRSVAQVRSTRLDERTFVVPDPAIAALIAAEHDATIGYVKAAVGRSDFRMSSYFAEVGDMSALAVVGAAQADYVRRYVQANLPHYAALPVLSMVAPFRAGEGGVADYTDVAAGNLALNNAADLYLYPNTPSAVVVDGAGLKAWLEKGALRFNTIDPARREPQELINTAVHGYDFDMLADSAVQYEIDLSRPPGQRIAQLRLHGQPVDAASRFVVATNNYRASGGGNFPGINEKSAILVSPDASRDVLIAYIRQQGQLRRDALGAQRSWHFARVKTAGPVVFHAPPGLLPLARQAGLNTVSLLRDDDGAGKGFALYAIELGGGH